METGKTTMKTFYCLASCAVFLVTLSTDSFAGDDLVCKKIDKSSFWDVTKDGCFKCPKGFKHDPKASVDTGACVTDDDRKGVSTGGKGPVCIAPAFVSLHDNKPWGVCMKCPHARGDVKDKAGRTIRWSPAGGYTHDHLKAGNEAGVCTRKRFARPKTVATNVVGGAARVAICTAAMATFKAGGKLPRLVKVPDVGAAVRAAGLSAAKIQQELKSYKTDDYDGVVDVLNKVKVVSDKFSAVRTQLFKPEILCDPSKAAAKLNELGLVPPGWNSDSYLTFSITFDLGVGVGGQGGYTLVTNFDEPPFVVGVVGATASTSAGYSMTGGVQYFPEVDDVKEFLGESLGASAGFDLGVLGAGVDVSLDPSKTGTDIFQGIGPHLSVGAGTSLGPGTVGFSLTNSWDMSKVQ